METLSRYFADVEMQPHNERAKLQLHAICRNPRPAGQAITRVALETEFNLDYNGVKLNKHGGLVDAVMLELENNGRIL